MRTRGAFQTDGAMVDYVQPSNALVAEKALVGSNRLER
jgi:hypothetical protein